MLNNIILILITHEPQLNYPVFLFRLVYIYKSKLAFESINKRAENAKRKSCRGVFKI